MSTADHNAAILPLLHQIVSAARTEVDQWILLETLAERLATGERGA